MIRYLGSEKKSYALKRIVYLVLMTILLSGCSNGFIKSQERETILIFAAASLTDAFLAIETDYEDRHEGVDLVFNFAGSQVLYQQILEGAACDIYFSANEAYPLQLEKQDGTTPGESKMIPFARSKLIGLADEGLVQTSLDQVIQSPDLGSIKIIMASETVPVGAYSLKALEAYLKVTGDQVGYDRFLGQIVSYEPDVKSVVAKVVLHEADLGLCYQTDAARLDLKKERLKILELPVTMAMDVVYGSINLSNAESVLDFYTYMLEGKGKAYLSDFGFVTSDQ